MSKQAVDDDVAVVDDAPAGDAPGQSFLEMSDEEMMNAPPPTGAVSIAPVDAAAADDKDDKDDADADDADDKDPPKDAPVDVKDDDADDAAAAGDSPDAKAADAVVDKAVDKAPVDKDVKVDDKPADPPKVEPAAVNYEAEYKRILAPFKANGRDIQVESVDDAITLMQQGANYAKKMAGLKPNLKLLKMLENNGFLNEDKISYLIDLGKNNPAAINKLVKDSGIDPMDLDAEKAKAYKQSTYAVDDREIELDTVLDEIQASPTYTRTLDVVSNKWDVASKQTVSQSPQLLKVINDHIASGIYDLINTEVERGRMLGRLSGLSDIEAYRQVGDSIQARGGFNHLGKPQAEKAPDTPVIVPPKPKKVEDDKLKDKRRAASSTQPAAPSTTPKDFNPLQMSDEEFSKLALPKFR